MTNLKVSGRGTQNISMAKPISRAKPNGNLFLQHLFKPCYLEPARISTPLKNLLYAKVSHKVIDIQLLQKGVPSPSWLSPEWWQRLSAKHISQMPF